MFDPAMRGSALGCAAALAVACLGTGGCKRAEPIRIGLVAGLTGRHYGLGVSCRDGAQLAVEELNAEGGVGGRQLELLVRNDAQQAEVARSAVWELIRAGAVAIVGHATSAMAEATLPIVEEEKILMVSPTVASPAFFGNDDWLVLMEGPASASAEAVAAYATRKEPGLRVSILHDHGNDPYGEAWRAAFDQALGRRGGRIVGEQGFRSGQVVSYGSLAASALEGDPGAVLIVANALDTAMLAQQLRKRSREVQLLGTAWGFTSEAIEHGGSALEGAIVSLRVNPEDPAAPVQRFRNRFQERFGRAPDYAAVLAHDAVRALARALARDATREGVRRELLRPQVFQGVTGEFTIDPNGDARRIDHIATVRDGRLRQVE